MNLLELVDAMVDDGNDDFGRPMEARRILRGSGTKKCQSCDSKVAAQRPKCVRDDGTMELLVPTAETCFWLDQSDTHGAVGATMVVVGVGKAS